MALLDGIVSPVAYRDIEDQRAASRRHYAANKQKYLERNTRYRNEIRQFIRKLKEETPCADCGNTYPYYVMDFDHLDADSKLHEVNYLSSTGRIGALKTEIVKCEIVCANCHRIRTHNRAISARSSVD